MESRKVRSHAILIHRGVAEGGLWIAGDSRVGLVESLQPGLDLLVGYRRVLLTVELLHQFHVLITVRLRVNLQLHLQVSHFYRNPEEDYLDGGEVAELMFIGRSGRLGSRRAGGQWAAAQIAVIVAL